MINKKEIIKKIALILIILSIFIYSFISYKNTKEEIIYSNSEFNINENKTEEGEGEKINVIEKIKVYVTGEVIKPGVIELEEGARIEDAINLAGGITPSANLRNVNLAYSLNDGQKLYIPSINDKENIEYIVEENGEGVVEDSKKVNGKVNINTADASELIALPGVGESMAQKIITYRNENGKFKNVEDLKNVSGIGEKKFESLKEYVIVK